MKTLMTSTAGLLIALGTAASAQSIDVNGAVAQGDTVTLPTVTATTNGYIVLHQVADGAPVVPQSIGHVAVSEGENTDVSITADMALEPGMSYAAMLHDETNGNDTYDFGEGATDVDTPTTMDGAVVVKIFRVGTPAGEADAAMAPEGEAMAPEGMESNDAMEATSPDSGEATMGMEAPVSNSGATAQ